MITKKIKALEQAKAKVQQLEEAVSRGLHSALASLPDEYGFESVDAFVSAVKTAAGIRNGKPGRPAKAPAAGAKRRRRATLTPAVRKAVVRLVKAGRTGAEIAATLQISLPSVQNIKKAAGLVRGSKKPSTKKAKPARKLAPKPRKQSSKPKRSAAASEPSSPVVAGSPAPSA